MAVVVIIAAVIIAFAVYRYSIWRRPMRPCKRCGGSSRNTDTTLFRGASGRCWRCGGKGQLPRLGVRVLMPSTYQDIKDGQTGKNY